MKITSLFFIAFLFLQINLLAQEGWIQQTSGTFADLYSVFFVNENVGWAVGDSAIVLKTTDGGSQWNHQSCNYNNNINSVYFTDINNGWFVGGSISAGVAGRVIFNTTDGGANWILQFGGRGGILNSVQFINQNIGWTCGWFGEILKTTNGGVDWDTLDSGSSNDFYSICFINNDVGWVLGENGTILKTIDGGETWLPQNIVGDPMALVSCTFIDENNGWITGNDIVYPGQAITKIFYTTDGGSDWFIKHGSRGWLNSIYFNNDTCGWAAGSGGWILFTSNKGSDWVDQMIPGAMSVDLYSIVFTDNNYGWAVGENGTIVHTANGGVSFVEENTISGIPTDYFLSQNYPNPFNPSTKIRYSVPQSSNVVTKVFDVLGNELETLVNEEKPIGTYELTWNAEGLPSGVYFYRLQAGSFVETRKMLLLK